MTAVWTLLARARRAVGRLRPWRGCTWCVGFQHQAAEFRRVGQPVAAMRQELAWAAHIAGDHPELVDRFAAALYAEQTRGLR